MNSKRSLCVAFAKKWGDGVFSNSLRWIMASKRNLRVAFAKREGTVFFSSKFTKMNYDFKTKSKHCLHKTFKHPYKTKYAQLKLIMK